MVLTGKHQSSAETLGLQLKELTQKIAETVMGLLVTNKIKVDLPYPYKKKVRMAERSKALRSGCSLRM